jgi:ribonuclease R
MKRRPRTERSRADEHVAPRDPVLLALERSGRPLTPADLAIELERSGRAVADLEGALIPLEKAGKIVRNRHGQLLMADALDLVRGSVIGHPDGFGFLDPDDGSEDLALSPREMRCVMHGDRVLVAVRGVDRRGRRDGHVVEVIDRAHASVVGRVYREPGGWRLTPENRRISQDLFVADADIGSAAEGQVVNAAIVSYSTGDGRAVARVVEVLGGYTDPGMEIEIALRKHALPHVFPDAVEAHCRQMPKTVRAIDRRGRRDLRELPLVTIDGETARDFDDAVYCEPATGLRGTADAAVGTRARVIELLPDRRAAVAFRLVVAIADVGHYVRHGDVLDLEARSRGNSVYFPRRVIPMLPEALSDELCSLKPQVDRLCLACDMQLTDDGDIAAYHFYPAVMHSRARLTYTAVADALRSGAVPSDPTIVDVLPQLRNLDRLFQALLEARKRRGAIDFETIETQMRLDPQGRIAGIDRVQRNDAHRMIEECMLAANVCASDFLTRHDHPTLYRVHDVPSRDRLEDLRSFLGSLGLDLHGGDEPDAGDYSRLLDRIRSRPDAGLLQTVMLRSLPQAVYSPENLGHFGLAYEAYAHFTSPIRRYPDLLVHRAIRAVLARRRYDAGDWSDLGRHCSQTERRADEATRDVEAWLKCFYMKDRVGATFTGVITGVAGFGLFVTLEAVYVEGLVHVSELGADYFRFDQLHHVLLGDRTGQRFRLGDRIEVRIARVDLDTARIELLPKDAPPSGARRSRR